MNEIDRLVDAALDSYPMAPTPPGFTDRVMAKITLQPKVAFHLDFLDLALPAFLPSLARRW